MFGTGELVVLGFLGILVLIFFGKGKLAEFGKDLGGFIKNIKEGAAPKSDS